MVRLCGQFYTSTRVLQNWGDTPERDSPHRGSSHCPPAFPVSLPSTLLSEFSHFSEFSCYPSSRPCTPFVTPKPLSQCAGRESRNAPASEMEVLRVWSTDLRGAEQYRKCAHLTERWNPPCVCVCVMPASLSQCSELIFVVVIFVLNTYKTKKVLWLTRSLKNLQTQLWGNLDVLTTASGVVIVLFLL